MDEILNLLERDARITPEEIASTLKLNVKDVKKAIHKFEKDGVILKYRAVLNQELMSQGTSSVKAIIEVKIVPERTQGFDRIAERIYQFDEVKSCYLLSGTYDLLLVVEGPNIQVVAKFVSEKLSTMNNVKGTLTHFLLKKYKEDGDILRTPRADRRLAVTQ